MCLAAVRCVFKINFFNTAKLDKLGQVGLCTSGVTTLRFGLMATIDQMTAEDMSAIAKARLKIQSVNCQILTIAKAYKYD